MTFEKGRLAGLFYEIYQLNIKESFQKGF
jgi:hypothetical protein